MSRYSSLQAWLGLESPGLLLALPMAETDNPAQVAPALPIDRVEGDRVALSALCPSAAEIAVEETEGGCVIRNGERAIRLPADGMYDGETPGPIVAWRLDGTWRGQGAVRHLRLRSAVRTTVESIGPLAVQWTTEWRWGSDGCWRWRARWAAGADTLEVVETISEDTMAAWEWCPVRTAAGAEASAWSGGGGEGQGPMHPLTWTPTPGAPAAGRRLLTPIAHISYFNQWCKSWVGFEQGDGVVAGIFTGWGGCWRRRGHVRPLVWLDADAGAMLQFPVRQGRRCYGLLLAETDVHAEGYCLLNQRKRVHSDFSPAKIRHWQLDPPVPERRSHLLPRPLPEALPCRPVEEIRATCAKTLEVAGGGYDGIIIFDGRRLKSVAFDLDARWANGSLSEAEYRACRRILLLAAYVFADPDYCTYGDFWPHLEPAEGIAEALKNEMGDCPVPPNFASEFFSTVGLVAELFPDHPLARAWRTLAVTLSKRFLEVHFAPDGTYAESLNYHTHALSELLCHFYPLWRNGHHDFFTHPAVRGSYEHLVQLQMPYLRAEGHAPLPANGNSGGLGKQQAFRGELVIGIDAYRRLDPGLAAQLVHVWERGGRPGPEEDKEHPVLTAALLRKGLPDGRAAPVRSAHRQSLGVVSRARREADGAPLWALFRAGRATHHMDFDQGHLMLAAWDKVLLGDHGYHTREADGSALPAASTWLHNTLTYRDDETLSSGYTGLERAPDPSVVHLGDAFDWCVLPIVNTDLRDLGRIGYREMLPTPPLHHTRHYLFVKPRYIVLWDVIEPEQADATFWLHAPEAWTQTGDRAWRAGAADEPHLDVAFAAPAVLRPHLNRQVGPLHALGLRGEPSGTFLAVLRPHDQPAELSLAWEPEARRLVIRSDTLNDTILLPAPGSTHDLPSLS